MRYSLLVTVFALLSPMLCHALGAESEKFVGVSADGRLTVMEYVFDGGAWNDYNALFGAGEARRFSYCWVNETPINPDDPDRSPRQSTHFVCSATRGGKPEVFYRRAHYDRSRHTGSRYKEAMILYKNARRLRGELMEYYFCDEGCGGNMPGFIFQIGFDST